VSDAGRPRWATVGLQFLAKPVFHGWPTARSYAKKAFSFIPIAHLFQWVKLAFFIRYRQNLCVLITPSWIR